VLTSRLVHEQNLLRADIALKEAQEARQRAEEASESKSEFLAHMSHELRTPLGGIIGLLDLINDREGLSEETSSYLQLAEEAGQSLLTILNDILDISKIEANQLQLEELEFSPVAVAKEVMRLMTPQAERKGVTLDLQADPAIPDTLIGDPTRLRQLMLNLISNALKFTPEGRVTVSMRGAPSPEARSSFMIEGDVKHRRLERTTNYVLNGSVQDTGAGMAQDTLDGLFREYFQGDCTVARRFGGTGLGLFICKRLCVMMGGDIDASSRLGEGSLFHFRVRLLLPTAPPVHPTAPRPRAETLPPLCVLVVEDNVVNQVIMKTILLRGGCRSVTIVANGLEAVGEALNGSYDLVLMDVEMPLMGGLEATRQIRQRLDTQALCIIGVSANAMKGDRERVLASGMNSYVTKPIVRSQLVAEILRFLPVLPASTST
jgi:signal transduction histidine kinase/CheY-like chemotaxis protein